MSISDMTSNFGIPTPPSLETFDGKDPFFPAAIPSIKGEEKDLDMIEPQIPTAPPSIHEFTDGSSDPSTPTSPDPITQSKWRYHSDITHLTMLIPQIAAAHQIKIPEARSYASSSSSVSIRSSSPGADTYVTSNDSSISIDSMTNASSTTSSKRKRKGIPVRSPNREDMESDPGMVFCFPVLFPSSTATSSTDLILTQQVSSIDGDQTNNDDDDSAEATNVDNSTAIALVDNDVVPQDKITGPSAIIIHHPVLLPDIIRSITQARRSKMRSRPVTRAKNKRENQELELLKLSGLDRIIDSPDNSGSSKNDDPVTISSRRTAATSGQKFMSSFSTSQMSRASLMSTSGDKQTVRTSTHENNNSSSYLRTSSNKRRLSMSASSLSSEPSDLDVNSDNFGDDEDDPDYTLPIKKRKGEFASAKTHAGAPSSTSHVTHRRDSGNRTKVCASCRTRNTPCWRPGWRPELFLCNSCGLRYKKTKCVCSNPECRYIPLKSEFNAMFKKPKNGDAQTDLNNLKRCCKCATVL